MKITDSCGQKKEIRVIDRIAPFWKRVGFALGVESHELAIYKNDKHGSVDCTYEMMEHWLESRTASWNGLLQALEEANQHELAKELKSILSEMVK